MAWTIKLTQKGDYNDSLDSSLAARRANSDHHSARFFAPLVNGGLGAGISPAHPQKLLLEILWKRCLSARQTPLR
jgi:hypothetical protein